MLALVAADIDWKLVRTGIGLAGSLGRHRSRASAFGTPRSLRG